MEIKYDGGGLAKGGDVTLYYDGEAVGKGRVERSQPMGYSADEACDVGSDSGSPASPDYGPSGNTLNRAIEWVQIHLCEDDHNRLIAPEERFKSAIARQYRRARRDDRPSLRPMSFASACLTSCRCWRR